MSDTAISIMRRLKEETKELHSLAESRPLQQQIARGEVDRERFAAYLGQLYLVHHALESALEAAKPGSSAVATMAKAHRMRVPDLEKDLAFYGFDASSLEAGQATLTFMDEITKLQADDPVALLGSLYVVEGSTNGGKFLARVLRKAWNLDGDGLSYFDPYGEDQPAIWAAFRSEMDCLDFDARQQDAILDAARATFKAIAEVSDEVAGAH
jgi:heme oxygenase